MDRIEIAPPRVDLVSEHASPLANAEDLDEAYRTAKQAQRDWAARLPSERADVMRRAARIMEARRDEIVDWHIRESGAAAPAAEFE